MDIIHRPRRLRSKEPVRRLIRETRVSAHDLIIPLFIVPGSNIKREIPSLPGVYHLSVDRLPEEIDAIHSLQIPGVILFGSSDEKDETGSGAYDGNGIVQQAVRRIKAHRQDVLVVTDVCLCGYTTHGHCGLVRDGEVDNDPSATLMAKTALSHAEAGADMVAPSDMMDGRVGAIRRLLDAKGYQHLPVMAYSAKYASAFYGPFREAARSAPRFGDRSSYQMDPANGDEALREIALDIQEGADIVMVKPALAYLDIIRRVKDNYNIPIAAYNVSGEYAMIKAAGRMGWLDEERAAAEMLTAIKRAGADIIITYFAKDYAAGLMKNEGNL